MLQIIFSNLMNKEEFYNFLSNPVLLSNITENDIDDIITEFPYFQTAYTLKAKVLSNKKSIKFDNQIKTTSLYALNRRLLYEYINTNYFEKNTAATTSKEQIIVKKNIEIEEKPKTIEPTKQAKIKTVEEPKAAKKPEEKPKRIVEEIKPAEEIIDNKEKTEPIVEIAKKDKLSEQKEIVEEKTEPIITENKQEKITAENTEIEKPLIINNKLEQEQTQKVEQVVEAKKEIKIIAEEPKEIVEEVKPEEPVKQVIKTRFSGKRTVADEILDKLRDNIENRKGESIADKILREAKERKAKKQQQIVEVKKTPKKIEEKPNPIIVTKKEEIKTKRKIYFVKINTNKLNSKKQEIETVVAENPKESPKPKQKIYFVKINANNLLSKSKTEEKPKLQKPKETVVLDPELAKLIQPPIASYYNIEDEITKKEKPISPSTEMGFADWLKYVENRSKQVEKTSTNSLIDKFISENPSISINIEDSVDTTKEEKALSKNKEDSFVTETLANIYIKQKHYDKAILAMKKLSLKYPQKNSYFANRINEIKNLIKG